MSVSAAGKVSIGSSGGDDGTASLSLSRDEVFGHPRKATLHESSESFSTGTTPTNRMSWDPLPGEGTGRRQGGPVHVDVIPDCILYIEKFEGEQAGMYRQFRLPDL